MNSISGRGDMMSRVWGIAAAIFAYECSLHVSKSYAMTWLRAETMTQRLIALSVGIGVLLLLALVFYKFASRPFFHGFLTATGLFLSVDIILFHWMFQLHRLTDGPESNVLEPVFVVVGLLVAWYGLKKEWLSKQIWKRAGNTCDG